MNQQNTESEMEKWERLYQNPEMIKERIRNWRSWGSWYSWGSPIGLGLFFVLIAFTLFLLHLAGIVG